MSYSSNVRTRQSSQSKLAAYMGPMRALLNSELPTLRAVLRQGQLYQKERSIEQESAKCNYHVVELTRDMTVALMDQWRRANVNFKVPILIGEKAVQDKLKVAWETVQRIVWNKAIKKN